MDEIDVLVERALASRQPKRRGEELYFLCPAHDDHTVSGCSWNRRKGVWKCLVCGAGGSTEDLARWLGIGITRRRAQIGEIVATYDYRDESGALLCQKVRMRPKRFLWRRPDGKGGWLWGRGDTRWTLYRLPELLQFPNARVYLVEGEKDADTLAGLGLLATTSPEGAQARSPSEPGRPASQRWRPEYTRALSGRDVVILPDNDQAGHDLADYVARELYLAGCTVRVLELPGLPPKGDVTDWIMAGGTREELERLADACPLWVPATSSSTAVPGSEHHALHLTIDLPLTDAGNAELFAVLYGDRVRWNHRLGRWLIWAGHRWQVDADGEVVRLAIAAARARARAALELPPEEARAVVQHAKRSESAAAIEAMLRIARAIPPIADDGDGWDIQPHLLGVANGVVDLTTGKLLEGRPDHRITRSTGIPYDPGADCPRWKQFLREVLEDDEEVIAFLQRAVGYSLTGVVSEQVWFLLHGPGANGKSTLVDTIAAIAGEYATDTPAEVLVGRAPLASGTATPELAALIGRRIVTCTETDDASRLNAARVKQLTGSSPITARPLYRDPVTFVPQVHLWLTTNHLPRVDDASEGFWRRVCLIPFRRVFAPHERDRRLDAKLRAELPGILRWAVEGAVEWYRDGLRPPPSVLQATDDYRQASDQLAEFIEACAVVAPECKSTRSQLYAAYLDWARAEGLPPGEVLGLRTFGRRMAERFAQRRITGGTRVYLGIGLKAE